MPVEFRFGFQPEDEPRKSKDDGFLDWLLKSFFKSVSRENRL